MAKYRIIVKGDDNIEVQAFYTAYKGAPRKARAFYATKDDLPSSMRSAADFVANLRGSESSKQGTGSERRKGGSG